MRKSTLVFLSLLLCFGGCKRRGGNAGAAAEKPPAGPNRQVIVKIADLSFSNFDLQEFIRLQYADTLSEKKEDPALLSLLLRQFIDQKLILLAAGREGIEATDQEVAAFLQKLNLDPADMKLKAGLVREMVKIQKYLSQKVYAGIDADDAEMERYYREHMADFNRPEEIFLYQILLDSREKAYKIRGELVNNPARFEAISRAESKAEETSPGGRMGFFARGQLPKEMEAVVFSLRLNQISPVVESVFGFHIFKVTERRAARQFHFFQVKAEIREKLLSDKMGAAYQEFLARLRAESPPQLFLPNLDFAYQENDGEMK